MPDRAPASHPLLELHADLAEGILGGGHIADRHGGGGAAVALLLLVLAGLAAAGSASGLCSNEATGRRAAHCGNRALEPAGHAGTGGGCASMQLQPTARHQQQSRQPAAPSINDQPGPAHLGRAPWRGQRQSQPPGCCKAPLALHSAPGLPGLPPQLQPGQQQQQQQLPRARP